MIYGKFYASFATAQAPVPVSLAEIIPFLSGKGTAISFFGAAAALINSIHLVWINTFPVSRSLSFSNETRNSTLVWPPVFPLFRVSLPPQAAIAPLFFDVLFLPFRNACSGAWSAITTLVPFVVPTFGTRLPVFRCHTSELYHMLGV